MAGRLGVDPVGYSYRELHWMNDGHDDFHDMNLRTVVAAIINTVSSVQIKPSDLKRVPESNNQEEMTEAQVISLAEIMGVVQIV